MRAITDIPRNMPDSLLKKLAAKGGVFGFQIGNDFHNRKAFDWRTAHAGKPFWDTSAVRERGALDLYAIDKLVAPQFPMVPGELPDDIRMSVDDWVGVVDRAIQLVGEDHVSLGTLALERAMIFYDACLAPLGLVRTGDSDRYFGYGPKSAPKEGQFYVTKPFDKNPATHGNGTMTCAILGAEWERQGSVSCSQKRLPCPAGSR